MRAAQLRYGTVAVLLHWTIALLILVNLGLGLDFAAPLPGERFSKKPFLPLHISLGLIVLVLSLGRVAWRLAHRPPPHPAKMQRWEVLLSDVAHATFYVLILAIPLTGWLIMSAHKVQKTSLSIFGIIPWPHLPLINLPPKEIVDALHDVAVDIHYVLAVPILIAMLALHVGAVIKHHVVDREPALLRMLPRWRA